MQASSTRRAKPWRLKAVEVGTRGPQNSTVALIPGSRPGTVRLSATITVYVTPLDPFVGVRSSCVTRPDALRFKAEMFTVVGFPTCTDATSDSGICAMICWRPPTSSISGSDPGLRRARAACGEGCEGKSENPGDEVVGRRRRLIDVHPIRPQGLPGRSVDRGHDASVRRHQPGAVDLALHLRQLCFGLIQIRLGLRLRGGAPRGGLK